MTRTKLLSILQEETDGFNEQSRLRDDVLDAMEEAYLKGKREQLNIPVVVGQSEQLKCLCCDGKGIVALHHNTRIKKRFNVLNN